jgi:hypothetical protein
MAKKLPNLTQGDEVAYAAKFLKDTRQQTGNAGARRGIFVRFEGDYARVKWRDADYSWLAHQYGADYAEDARENGQLVHRSAICRVGSARFACNDL